MPTVFPDGPYLVAATLCERTMQEADSVLSLIRIVDRFTATITGPSVPATMPTGLIKAKLVVILKTGNARGRYALKFRTEEPSGLQREAIEVPVNFTGAPDTGVNVLIDFNLNVEHEGLYWIDVLMDAELLTRIPLRVLYEPRRLNS